MAVTLFVLSAAFHAGASGQLAWIAVLSVAAFVGFFAIGLGPVFWLLIAEIFPLAQRGRAMSLATVANWGFNLVVSATFLNLVGAFGSAGAFLVYAILSLAALVFIALLVPETKGRSLEQIEVKLDTAHVPLPVGRPAPRDTLPFSWHCWFAAIAQAQGHAAHDLQRPAADTAAGAGRLKCRRSTTCWAIWVACAPIWKTEASICASTRQPNSPAMSAAVCSSRISPTRSPSAPMWTGSALRRHRPLHPSDSRQPLRRQHQPSVRRQRDAGAGDLWRRRQCGRASGFGLRRAAPVGWKAGCRCRLDERGNDFASSPLYCNYMNNGLCGDPKALPGGDIGHSAFPDAVGPPGSVCVQRRPPMSLSASTR